MEGGLYTCECEDCIAAAKTYHQTVAGQTIEWERWPRLETARDPVVGGWVARLVEHPGFAGQGESIIEAMAEALDAWQDRDDDET